MSTLHIVRSSAYQTNQLQQCLLLLKNTDRIFLLDDGVYNLNHPLLSSVSNQILILEDHTNARNIVVSDRKGSMATYNDLVSETENAEKVITWQ